MFWLGRRVLPHLGRHRFFQGCQCGVAICSSDGRKLQSKIYLAHVIPAGRLNYALPESAAATGQLLQLTASVDWQSVSHETILLQGPVWQRLRETIQVNEIDLVAWEHGGAPAIRNFF
jgi:hypothetical protein